MILGEQPQTICKEEVIKKLGNVTNKHYYCKNYIVLIICICIKIERTTTMIIRLRRVLFLGHQKRYYLSVISLFSGTNISLMLQLRASHILSSTENSIEAVLL